MRLLLLCVSKRPVDWVAQAAQEYVKRLSGKLDIQCRELAPAQHASTRAEQRAREATAIAKAIPTGAHTIALDERGEHWTTAALAIELDTWRCEHKDVVLIIGGAEGLDPDTREAAARVWSLSRLTLPHQLVRVIVLEQIYRAWSLLHNHPYHRA